jgi:uncharacterized protein (TIGR03435 family)
MGPLLQSRLEDRFQLVVHRETRQMPMMALTVAKKGLKLRPSKEGTCVHWSVNAPPPALEPGGKPPVFRSFGFEGNDEFLDKPGSAMAERTGALTRAIRHQSAPARDAQASAPDADAAGPSIYSALEEQLGLKLESVKGPVEVLVIDHVERPSAN